MTTPQFTPRINRNNYLVQASFSDRKGLPCFIGESSRATDAAIRIGIVNSNSPAPLLGRKEVRRILPRLKQLAEFGWCGSDVKELLDYNGTPIAVHCQGDSMVFGPTKGYQDEVLTPRITLSRRHARALTVLLNRFLESGRIDAD